MDKINNLKITTKIIIMCLLGLICAIGVEVFYNITTLRLPAEQKGVFDISQEDIKYNGFEYVDGRYVMTGDTGHIEILTSMPFVNKLTYSIDYDKDVKIQVNIVHARSEVHVVADTVIDKNSLFLDESTVKVNGMVASVDLFFDETAKGISLGDFKYVNESSVNLRRFCMVFFIVIMFIALIFFNSFFTESIERGFVIAALTMGVIIISMLPSVKVAWDEAYHFRGAYLMSVTGKVVTNDVIETYLNDEKVENICYPQTKDENAQINRNMGKELNYTDDIEGNIVLRAKVREIKDVGHLASSIGINIGRVLKLPFPVMYFLGRLFNLLMYVTVVYFAIKHAKIGKRILTLIALMPTSMFVACTYSYDATLNAFMFLGMSLMFSAFADKEYKHTWKWYIAYLVSMFVVCSIKMIYAPMFLLFVFMPKDRFKDKKTMYIMKAGLFAICLLIVAIMILPTLISPAEVGDTRETKLASPAGQLRFILGNKLYYATILLKCIMGNLFDFMTDISGLGLYGHIGQFAYPGIIAIVVILIAVTDVGEYHLKPLTKVLSAGIVFAVICLIWTALYMSFTAVGYNEIVGVQGRYYIPLMLPTFLLLNSSKIKNEISPKLYNAVVFVAPMVFGASIMMGILENMFF